uniref:NADH dehydrogenase subunit 3 n=1 Tax=Resomia ornicephala TaxID=557396 RepID=UPI0026E224B0|nr:NADH dehydrogenase subunit 3 [Resomia ornicephala]WJJ70071.1 NADH dehydrogenase subunit 3 [Resomia ornicephala]WJJ70083.1 NADH dehydrogenase subunit 3 [Resomia ornicephala]
MEFITLCICVIISFILSFVICILSFILCEKNPDKEKVSIYECGFNPVQIPGKPFSIRFFVIAILFLVFDLEISYLFPWSMNSNIIDIKGQIIVIFFLIILSIGLIYEWIRGGLEWE